jgi:tetratricopeptide (TPR) repeat protein
MVAELRRRRVFRALLAWGVVSFAVLQVVEPMMHGLDLPPWTLRAVIGILAAGFPVTSVLAWVFDLGRAGITWTPDAPGDAEGAAPPAHRRPASMAALVVASALLGAGLAVLALRVLDRQPAAGPDGRITVAVADFANETRDPDLDGLSGLLITSLEQSSRLRVLTRSRMVGILRDTGRDATGRIDEEAAREVGRRTGARALLLASVKRLDDVYAVEMRALDPQRDEYLFTVRDHATSKKGLLDVVDRLSERTRRNFRETGTDVSVSHDKVAATVTGSLEAHRHYFEGLRYLDAYKIPEGIRALNAAIEIDPGFALARLQLLVGLPRVYRSPSAQRALVEALVLQLDRLPEGDRLVVRAEEAFLDGRIDEGFALYARAEAGSPDDKRILAREGYAQLYLRTDPDAAVRLAERALALDPGWGVAQDLMAVSLVTRGDDEQALLLAREWAERWPSALAVSVVQGALLHMGDAQGAMAAARRCSEMSDASDPAGWALTRSYVQLGDMETAEKVARAGWSWGHESSHMVLASVLRLRGKRRAAEQAVDAAERAGVPAASRLRVQLAIGDGDPSRALELARKAGPGLAPGDVAGPLAMAGHAGAAETWLTEAPAFSYFGAVIPPGAARRMAEAVRARDARDFATARRVLVELRAGRNRPVARQAAYVLGETCFLEGDHACVVETLSSYTPFHWMLPTTSWSWPRSLYMLAVAEERLGWTGDARGHAKRLVDLWKDADPDLPLLAEARALLAKLDKPRAVQGGKP